METESFELKPSTESAELPNADELLNATPVPGDWNKPHEEGLTHGEDTRKPIKSFPEIDSIGQLFMRYSEGNFIGTGCIIHVTEDRKRACVLSCGHNFVNSKTGDKFKAASFHYRIMGSQDTHAYQIYKVVTRKEFVESRGETWDISLAFIQGENIPTKHYTRSYDEQYQQLKDPVTVRGYPGEKQSFPYYGEGNIKAVKKDKLFYDVDTTGGNSGSPFIAIVNQQLGPIIGVHIAYIEADNLNLCTRYTKEVHDWVEANLTKELNK
jgi:V8-like Glu-specific endopeptidase